MLTCGAKSTLIMVCTLSAAIAKKVVGPTTPVVDLYSAVTAKCGKEYTDCSICRKTPCSYHYNSEGMEMQAKIVADAISKQLAL